MSNRRVTTIALILAATSLTQPAFAQQSADAAEEPSGGDEILVTARKTRENLQQVPIAITALQSDTLEKANTRQLRDVATLTPGLSIAGDGAERGQQPTIRGISFAGDQNSEGNVAVMLDGFFLANPGSMSMGLMEFERIEVVKGPQSALYGHNAFAGAINYVPKAPPKSFEATAQLRVGSYGTRAIKGTIGGPIVDGLIYARLSATDDRQDGAYTDRVNGKQLGGFKKQDVSLQVQILPSDRATIDLGFYYGDDTFGRAMQVNIQGNCQGNRQYCGEVPDPRQFEIAAPSFEPVDSSANDRLFKHARIRATYDLDVVTATLSGAYFNTKSRSFSELFGERYGIPYTLVGVPAGTVTLPGFFGGALYNEDFEVELRFASDPSLPLRWAAGAYYYHSDQDSLVEIAVNSDAIPQGRTIVCPFNLACLWLSPGGVAISNPGRTVSTNKQVSAFGSLSYDVTDGLTVTTELRYTKEDKFNNVINVATTTGPAANPDGDGMKAKFTFWNPRFTVNYQVTPDHLLYASVAKGSKSGGFNQRAIIVEELTFGPEKNWTYEIGSKNSFFNGRLRVNLAAFRVDWSDLQSQVPSVVPGNVGAVTANYGSVRVYGGELEVFARVADGVSLTGGVAYTQPKFGADAYDFATAFCASVATCAPRIVTNAPSPAGPRSAVSLNGLIRNGVSQWQFVGGLDVNKPLTDDWDWFAAANYKYESRQFQEVTNSRWIGGRNTLSLSAGVENGNLRLSVWAQNALNDLTALNGGGGFTRYNDFSQVPKIQLPDKRRIGVTMDYRF